MKPPVRIGMLGSGYVADRYMQALANVKDQQVIFNYSRSLENASAFAKKWSIPEYTDLRQVVFRDDIDLFVIALPNEEHLPVSLALSAAKRNQVCPKPLGRNRAEARQMLDAARQSEALHGYGETEVFAPAVVRAKETVDRGDIGNVLRVRSRASSGGPRGAQSWDVEKTGGGALYDLGCHGVAVARYVFGKSDKVTEVMAWGSNLAHREKTKGEDNALLVMQMASGGLGQCDVSWTQAGGLDLRNEIYGSQGALFTEVTAQTSVSAFTKKTGGRAGKGDADFAWVHPLPEESIALGYHAGIRHFVECVRDGVTPRETFEDGHAVNCVLEAGYTSMREHRWVNVEY